MKISPSVLSQYIDIPEDHRELRELLDDVGIEVKRIEESEAGIAFNLELLANRGDHACYEGVAREISGRTGASVRLPSVPHIPLCAPADFPVEVLVESALCLHYSATLMERVSDGVPFPKEVLAPLLATGVHAISAPVDATNLSNLEFGQPTHAFDADTLVGAVRVRLSSAGEQAWPLFQEGKITLPEGTLVIADDEKILAIAGVIGCEESKTTASTTRLLVESATFDPISVRKTSRALNLHTDSSARFERGANPALATVGAARVVGLLEQYAGWRRVSDTLLVGEWADPGRLIPLEIPVAASFLEYPLTAEEVATRLTRYGFRVSPPGPRWDADDGWIASPEVLDRSRDRNRTTVLVRVPPGRLWDVEFPDDLYEELAKSIGYNNTPSDLPQVDMGKLPSREEQVRDRVEDVLLGMGFYEVFTNGFYGRETRERLGFDERHPLWEHVEVQNAIDRGYSLLKNNALGQAVEALAANTRWRQEEVRMYEWTRTFHLDEGAPNGVCRERKLLWALASGPAHSPSWRDKGGSADPWLMRGLVEEIAAELRLPLAVVPGRRPHPLSSALHPNRQAAVVLGDKVVGLLGEVHPTVVAANRIKRARPVYLELDLPPLLTEGRALPFADPPELHPINRSLAFTLPQGVYAGDVAALLKGAGPSWLTEVAITDLFEHQEDGQPRRAVTFALTYANDEVRTSDEVNSASDYLVKVVEQRFGEAGVRQRA
ncbi:MAG: phenylalanine--tRNA ligase subunit beta [Deltaproteobacteria bacterium]|nr:phenylalanine--tRNA ligase subunit beta [Deltaproteobacteria bacterium]